MVVPAPIARIGVSVIGNARLIGNIQLFTEFLFTNRQSTQLATPGPNAAPTAIGAKAPALTYHNVQLKYAVSKAMNVSFGMDNLLAEHRRAAAAVLLNRAEKKEARQHAIIFLGAPHP